MNNYAAIGYAIIAAKRLGLIGDSLVKLEANMKSAFDEFTDEEAEEVWRNT